VEAGDVRGHELDADSIDLSDVPAQCVGPEPREFVWCDGVEGESDELDRHRTLGEVIVVIMVIIDATEPLHAAG
jgi:hypothetical protein